MSDRSDTFLLGISWFMTKEQIKIVRKFEKLVKEAKAAGLTVFCDVEVWGFRIVPDEEMKDFDCDPREMGMTISVHSTCGTPSGPKDGIPVM